MTGVQVDSELATLLGPHSLVSPGNHQETEDLQDIYKGLGNTSDSDGDESGVRSSLFGTRRPSRPSRERDSKQAIANDSRCK